MLSGKIEKTLRDQIDPGNASSYLYPTIPSRSEIEEKVLPGEVLIKINLMGKYKEVLYLLTLIWALCRGNRGFNFNYFGIHRIKMNDPSYAYMLINTKKLKRMIRHSIATNG